jgi:hypothetical protein
MIQFGTTPPHDAENSWRYQLDQFVSENQRELAALAWGLRLEWGESQDTLGIDCQPQPHFVACSRESVETLNRKVNNQLREVLGILDGYNPEKEVVILGIGKGQIKLINFQPNPSPPLCFAEIQAEIDVLITQLETRLNQM